MNPYILKNQVTIALKRFLESKGFQEVLTPVLRRDSGDIINRIALPHNLGYLRDSHELQLRWLLSEFSSIYEIGSCFREESGGKTKGIEFQLMELFTSEMRLDSIKEMVKEFILLNKRSVIFEEVSVAGQIKKELGIDLAVEGSQNKLYEVLKTRYGGKYDFQNDYQYVMHYIETEIEPLSQGRVVFFTDYPECTCSYAEIKSGDIISRFELFANGLEIANGFDDECDPERFDKRNRDLPIFPNEETAVVKALSQGKLPNASAGVGIGIERLCMFIFGIEDIHVLSFPSNAF